MMHLRICWWGVGQVQGQAFLLLLISYVHLEALTVHLKCYAILASNVYCAEWVNLLDDKRSRPSGFELTRKESQARVKEKNEVPFLEVATRDAVVMHSFSALFVHPGIIVGVKPCFLQLMQVKDALLACCLQVHVDGARG